VTLFGLLFTPTFYVVVRGVAGRLKRFKKEKTAADAGVAPSGEALKEETLGG
jgi:hypothetical protein